MSNAETAVHIRRWCEGSHGPFSWPTDACGYDQHVRFVRHRNNRWGGGTADDFRVFVLAYADSIEASP